MRYLLLLRMERLIFRVNAKHAFESRIEQGRRLRGDYTDPAGRMCCSTNR